MWKSTHLDLAMILARQLPRQLRNKTGLYNSLQLKVANYTLLIFAKLKVSNKFTCFGNEIELITISLLSRIKYRLQTAEKKI